jgi:serine/threonine-protein kinase SRPK3
MSSNSNYSADEDEFIDWTGCELNKKYIMLEKLGAGSYAVVWLAYNKLKKELVAIKLHYEGDYSTGVNEGKMLNIFNHDIFIKKIDEFEYEKKYCIVLEIMICSLYDIIKKYNYLINYELIDNVIKKIDDGLKIIHHKGYIHADLKPENILIGGTCKKYDIYLNYFDKKFNEDLLNTKKILLKESRSDISKTPNKSGILSEKKLHAKDIKKSAFKLTIKNFCNKINKKNNRDEYDSESESYSDREFDNIKKYKFGREYLDTNNILSSSEEESEEDNMEEIKINKIVISDLGSIILNTKKTFNLQTRYYRSPSIILREKTDKNIDYWSFGCLIYELLTGKILFNPDNHGKYNINRLHMYLIQNILDNKEFIYQNKNNINNDIYYKKNGMVKGFEKINFVGLNKKIENNLLSNLDKKKLISYLSLILKYFKI